jgi:hypothetical protein
MLFDNIARASTDVLVIDTGVARGGGRALQLRRESLSDPRSSSVNELVTVPTVRAVMYLCRNYRYEVVPLRPNMTDYRGMPDYKNGERYALIAAKKTSLSGLDQLRLRGDWRRPIHALRVGHPVSSWRHRDV